MRPPGQLAAYSETRNESASLVVVPAEGEDLLELVDDHETHPSAAPSPSVRAVAPWSQASEVSGSAPRVGSIWRRSAASG